MFFAEFAPPPRLAAFLHCIWVFEADHGAAAEAQRIVPDGHPELLLHYGDPFLEYDGSASGAGEQSRLVFAGQITGPLLLQPGRRAGVIGVRFRPAGARALLGELPPLHELLDARLDLATPWGQAGESLLDEIHEAAEARARVAIVERFLLRRLDQVRHQPDAAVSAGVRALQASEGELSIDALAASCEMSGRQLERRFRAEVGVPPRLLASILRFRRVFDRLESPQAGRWVEAALAAGYFDQAHMVRDFRRFAGLPPAAFHRSLQGLSAAMVGAADVGFVQDPG
ncbi:DUF6597 domain-containing transcriptional factor [Pelomonas sp. SE-A7]|uniref:DUF6597 domain-containing transcriptional factor n=1 Tax=Pelomonas sp. SE-A7 TaxID=3054953 RepID=UPI00259C9EBA|nr:DUF6597 domain-containing transcriptional factor [Pelomonas sp. SE-A7]MDM4765726.1 helix-turn-helix domain-containing protein [Pelomonas sp. SE-A7]